MRAVAAVLGAAFAVALVAPPASAQEMEKEKAEHAEMHEQAHKAMGKHTMTGTMTPPDGETLPVRYEMEMGEDGPHGTIVGTQESGEEIRVQMQNLRMEEGKLMYSFSPPDEETLVVSCVLERQDGGGFAGDCTDNQEGKTGHMTIEPMKERMEKMNPCEAGEHMEHMEKMNPCGAARNPCGAEKSEEAANPCGG